MKRSLLLSTLTAVAAFICLSSSSFAQTRDRFVISAKAGGINAVTGRASMHGRGTGEWQQLTIQADLEAGDVVKTSANSQVEMLLNPGSYLRVGENSEFELSDNSLANLEVRLIRGTAIVEATGDDDTDLAINITTPHTRLSIVRRGLYRLNVVPGNTTELIVRKGRVMLEGSHTKVKGGNKVVFSGGGFLIAKLTKDEQKQADTFDNWSKERADTVAQANRKLHGRDVGMAMASFRNSFWDSFSGRRSGIWMFNSRYQCYTFLPFYLGWGSPYGSTYSRSFYPWYGRPYGTVFSSYPSPSTSSGGQTAGPNSPAPGRPGPASPPERSAPRQLPPASQRKIIEP